MTMIMQDQSKRLSEPLRWGRRERTSSPSCSLRGARRVGLGAYALTSGAPARRDCVEVTFASTLGGAQVHECGAKARRCVRLARRLQGVTAELRAACRKAGFPFG